ncbi:MAG TPA: hypothetical protein VGR96_03840 [Acidobacteriaceae bacterium]|nr:hypothetical protein [Acidobacteriaceae bacterium]
MSLAALALAAVAVFVPASSAAAHAVAHAAAQDTGPGTGGAAAHSSATDTDAAAAQNQQKARAALNAMIAALGGDRWLTLATTMQEGEISGFYQGKPTGEISKFIELHAFPSENRIELGKKRNVLEIFSGDQGWEITYRGKRALPADQVQDYVRRRDHSIEAAARIWLKDPKTILIYDGQNQVERHLADQVTLINAENDSITIQMDAESHLPLRRSWQWRDPLYKDKNTDAEEYDDYHVVNGIPTPYSITRFHNGDMNSQRFLSGAAYNLVFAPGLFDPDKAAAKIKK